MTANSRDRNSQNSRSDARIDHDELREWQEWAEKWISEQKEEDEEKGLRLTKNEPCYELVCGQKVHQSCLSYT